MKKVVLLMIFGLFALSGPSFAKDKKPMRPARETTSNTDLYKLVWRCTFTVTADPKTTTTCAAGMFTGARKFVSIPATKEHREIGSRLGQFLTGLYGHETYPYEDSKSKKPVSRPDRCAFELTHGESSEAIDEAVIRVRSGTCPLMSPSEQFLFQKELSDGVNHIVYERGDVPGGLAENNDD